MPCYAINPQLLHNSVYDKKKTINRQKRGNNLLQKRKLPCSLKDLFFKRIQYGICQHTVVKIILKLNMDGIGAWIYIHLIAKMMQIIICKTVLIVFFLQI